VNWPEKSTVATPEGTGRDRCPQRAFIFMATHSLPAGSCIVDFVRVPVTAPALSHPDGNDYERHRNGYPGRDVLIVEDIIDTG